MQYILAEIFFLTLVVVMLLNIPCGVDIPEGCSTEEAVKIAKRTYHKGVRLWILEFGIWLGAIIGFFLFGIQNEIIVLPFVLFGISTMCSGPWIDRTYRDYKAIAQKVPHGDIDY